MFPIGTTCLCASALSDGSKTSSQVRVLDHREGDLVYVHYVGNDSRLDEWVSASRLSRTLQHSMSNDEHDHHHHDGTTRKRKHSTREFVGSDSEDGEHTRKIWHHGAGHGHEHTKVRNIQKILLGDYLIDAWYYSPYPAPYDKFVDRMFVCQDTFKYMRSAKVYGLHLKKLDKLPANELKPPGDEIYRDENLSVFRVEGSRQRLYCQNLCLLGKLFIEHKTLHFDPTPFFFFVICERYEDDRKRMRFRPVGYFSKEKDSPDGYNLACILTLPPFQRKGYGKFIISLSYELSKREGKVGSPEKPLSDLGKLSYRAFWSCRLLTVLSQACASGDRPGVKELSQQTGIRVEDTVSTLQALGLIKHLRGSLVLSVSPDHIRSLLEPFHAKNFAASFCKPDCFLMQ